MGNVRGVLSTEKRNFGEIVDTDVSSTPTYIKFSQTWWEPIFLERLNQENLNLRLTQFNPKVHYVRS